MLSSALHGLRLILSPVTPPPLSPQMCSELDVRDPELLHSSNRTAPNPVHWEGTLHPSPSPVLSIEPGLGGVPPQLEENHVVPTAWQDEALARDGVSRDVE